MGARLSWMLMFAAGAISTGCDLNRDPEEQAWDPEPRYPTEAVPRGEVERPFVDEPRGADTEEQPAFEQPGVPSGVPSPGPEPEDVYR